jgi:hypothetical protein
MVTKIKENAELISIIIVSIGVIGLDVAGVTDNNVVLPAILAVLALLAFSGIHNRKISTQLKVSLDELNKKIQGISDNEKLINFGVKGIFKNKPVDFLSEKYENATNSIRILHSWLESVPLPVEIFEAAKKGVKVQILLLNPESQPAKLRAKSLGHGENSDRTRILLDGVINSIRKNANENCNIELFLYEEMPSFSIYSIDKCIVMGFYWSGKASISGPHFEIIEKENGLSVLLNETFNNILKNSTKQEIK